MKRWLCVLWLVACGDDVRPDPELGGGSLIETVEARVAATLSTEAVGYALAALDEDRLAVARVDVAGEAFCPDCTTLDPADCPALCERSTITISILDVETGALDPGRPVATVFPETFDHDVGQLELVSLGGERVGLAWLDCDNATCNGTFASRSCTARYTTVELATGDVGPVQTLYTDRFADLHLAFDTATRRLLAVTGKDLAVSAGLYRAIFDDTGATVLSPWTPLGSPAARSPAVLARDGELLVVADDSSPARPPLAAPCAVSCACLDFGTIEPAGSGLFAYRVAPEGDTAELVAPGLDDQGFYGRREELAVIDAGGATVIASTQSIDRSAELFVDDGDGWTRRLQTEAPIPLWIGALGTRERQAWIGAEPEPGEAPTVQRLVLGLAGEDLEERATLGEPAARAVFATAPVATAAGVTTTFLLQGLFPPAGGSEWDRFEVLELRARW